MKVFIAGPRLVKKIDRNISNRLENIWKNDYTVIVGDADGIDSCVQRHFYDVNYENVIIYASNGIARNNIGKWKVENVVVEGNIRGFDFYSKKDIEMSNISDYGFIIWNGESKGTFNNMVNLVRLDKTVLIYYLPTRSFHTIKNVDDLYNFVVQKTSLNNKLIKLISNIMPDYTQLPISN